MAETIDIRKLKSLAEMIQFKDTEPHEPKIDILTREVLRIQAYKGRKHELNGGFDMLHIWFVDGGCLVISACDICGELTLVNRAA